MLIVSASQGLIATSASVISAGSERFVVDLARKSLMSGKDLQRLEDVNRVLWHVLALRLVCPHCPPRRSWSFKVLERIAETLIEASQQEPRSPA